MALEDPVEVALSFPFSVDDYGNLAVTTNADKIWADRVASVIGTTVGERVMRPSFGTKVSFASWATRSAMEDVLYKEINRGFYLHLNLLTLENIEFNYNEAESIAYVSVSYSLPDKRQATTRVGVVVLDENNPPYEETT